MHRFESLQTMISLAPARIASWSPSSTPRYSASLTEICSHTSEATSKISHVGHRHKIALYSPLLRSGLAEPSELMTNASSPAFSFGNGHSTRKGRISLFRGAMSFSISSTSRRGVILAAKSPRTSSSPLADFSTVNDHGDRIAAHCCSRP